MQGYNKDLAKIVDDALKNDDWQFGFEEDEGLFHFGLNLDGRIKEISYFIDVLEDEILFYGILPVTGDPAKKGMMADLAEFTSRANFGLKNGNFEVSFETGEIRYMCYVGCIGSVPSEEMVINCVSCIATMIGYHAPGILGILFAGMDAERALEECRRANEEPSDSDGVVDNGMN